MEESKRVPKGRVKKLVKDNIDPDENVQFVIVGEADQCIVALEDRLLVVKPGARAMAPFGGKMTSLYYRDITGIEVNVTAWWGVIEVNTPSYQGTQAKENFGRIGLALKPDRDPFQVSNCVPITKRLLNKQQTQLDGIRAKIRQAKQVQPTPTSSTVAPTDSISTELQRLASLRDSGILTDEEFQQAKKKLLS